ncbi:hypothetical protein GQ85_03405 [Rhodococcus rhodochrous]|nr:hypothetical protein GQ85_03405 [Rhodococcus rhodochrous]
MEVVTGIHTATEPESLDSVMYMSALTAIRCDGPPVPTNPRKRDHGRRYIPATICLARRRVNVLYALLRDNRTWQPEAPVTAVAARHGH